MKVGRNESCPCGSGKKYKSCHLAIEEASPEQLLSTAHAVYCRSWSENSSSYETQRIYADLAAHLISAVAAKRVVDFGCGDGRGLAAIWSAAKSSDGLLVGLDENPICLTAAKERLMQFGTIIHETHRMGSRAYSDGTYSTFYEADIPAASSGIVLAQTDFLLPDPGLELFLNRTGPYDAVTLWFVGTHGARARDRNIAKQGISGNVMLRERVEDVCFEIAKRHLRSGGILQIASRFSMQNSELVEADFRQGVADLEHASDLHLSGVRVMHYHEPDSKQAIALKRAQQDVPQMPAFAVSGLFVKS